MKFRNKIINLGYTNYQRCTYQIPDLCPICRVSNNPKTIKQASMIQSSYLICFFSHLCSSCEQYHYSIQKIYPDSQRQDSELLALAPQNGSRKFLDLLENLSPRFIDMYHQAEQAENNGSFDLAGIGYRAALEILIKDYALKYSGESKENIAKYQLNSAIGHFFKQDQTDLVSADVVRIIGNDYAHWNRPDGFDSKSSLVNLKNYLDIYIDSVKMKLRIQHPVVSRNKTNQGNTKENK